MGGDHDAVGDGVQVIVEGCLIDAERVETLAGDGVVDELAEDGEGLFMGESLGEGEGVADAEADAVMFSEVDGHDGGGFVGQSMWANFF